MNKFGSRFGALRDEFNMLAVKKLMPESLLNYRFRGTTMSDSEIVIALESIIVDKVSRIPSSKSRRNATSAPTEIGMAAEEDGESVSKEGDQRIMHLALQAVHKGTGKGKWRYSSNVKIGMRKAAKVERMEERTRGRRGQRQERRKRAREGWQRRIQNMLDVRQDRTHCSLVQKRRKQKIIRH